MMKYLNLFFSLLLFTTSTCLTAVELKHHQAGDVALIPFFTVENGWDSLITISTAAKFSSGNTKIILEHPGVFRIRILDAIDGQLLKSMVVYNRRIVNWRASLTKIADGVTRLQVAEGDCLITDNQVLEGDNAIVDFPATSGMIEAYAIGQFYTHDTCTEIANHWLPGGRWSNDPADGVTPDSRLHAELTLVNAEQGLAVNYEASVLADFSKQLQHMSPSVDYPTLAAADPIFKTENGDLVTPNSGLGIDAVALALSIGKHAFLSNDVVTLDSIGARTDWIISYPLAGYKNFRPFTVDINGQTRHCESLAHPSIDNKPMVKIETIVSINTLVSEGQGERLNGGSPDFSPLASPIERSVSLCNAVNILSFDKPSILVPEGSAILEPLSNVTVSPNSSLIWHLIEPVFPLQDGIRRPLLAYRLTSFVNGTLDNGKVLANYAVFREHTRE